MLNPEWEELASKVKGFVKIAYWDTEKSGQVPPVLGEIRGTPTIKLLRPKRKAKTNKQKDVVDYNMERKASDMSTFALDLMPSFVERVNGPEDFTKFKNKASKYGLPMMLFFAEDRRIMNEMKYLSTEFRKRVLIAQIPFTKKENKNIFFEYGVRGQALLVVPPSDEGDEGEAGDNNQQQNVIVFDGKWSLHRLKSFFSEHALESEVKPKPKEEAKPKEEEQKKEEKKEGVKSEL
mmetsp:Transcript_26143/g.44563  ORF Transcript_26143/g.44563 Transcript_26143/m.44563 type:complete len:235 (+) Transcript_26143:198-902(+)